MFCPVCGTKCDDRAVYCPNCGKAVSVNGEECTQLNASQGETPTQYMQTDMDKTVRAPEMKGVSVSAPQMSANSQAPAVSHNEEKPEKKKRKKGIAGKIAALVLTAVIVAAGIVTAGYFMIEKASDGNGIPEELALGNKYLNDMEYDKAILTYETVLDLDPNNYEATCGYAKACVGKTDYDKAESLYRKAIKLRPDGEEAYHSLAELYIQNDDKPQANSVITQAMKNNVNSDRIVEKHNGLNPEAPDTNLDPDNYNKNMRYAVSLVAPNGGTIYYKHTYDGFTPTDYKLFTEPIILRNGTNIIEAYVMSSYGVESGHSSFDYVVDRTDVEVVFADRELERAVRDKLGIWYGPLYDDDLASITELTVVGTDSTVNSAVFTQSEYYLDSSNYGRNYMGNIVSLSDLKYMPFLKTLNISFQTALDLSTIEGCEFLENLSLINVNATSLGKIPTLTSLKKLCLGWNNITDISEVSSLTNLTHLGLWGNSIKDISAVSALTKLEYLDISDNAVSDISAVSSLSELEDFWAYGNSISDFSPLTGLNKLDTLMINGNPVKDKDVLRKIYPRLKKTDIEIN